MANLSVETDVAGSDPLETLEIMARHAEIDAQRIDDFELHISVTGAWKDISLWFAWRTEAQVLQVGAPLEMKVPMGRIAEVTRLLAIVNERLWLGHFDLWEDDKGLVYRHGLILPEGQGMDESQAEIVIRAAMDAIDRFYPAFNFVVWGEKSAAEAMDAAILETAGTA